MHKTTFTLSYAVSNACSTTLQTCFATNTAGDPGGTGAITGSPTAQNKSPTVPGTAGTYTLIGGGMESGFATLNIP